MALTAIVLANNDGILVPSLPSVPVVRGDSIAFSTDDGGPAYLYFSPAAIQVLSPTPAIPFGLSEGGAEFTFTSSDPGAYSVFFETSPSPPPVFPVLSSGLLTLEIDAGEAGFGTPDHRTKGG